MFTDYTIFNEASEKFNLIVFILDLINSKKILIN